MAKDKVKITGDWSAWAELRSSCASWELLCDSDKLAAPALLEEVLQL